MRFLDLFRMSFGNLFRRKMRSILTILGVTIGTTSIVVMMSLGIGMNYSFMEQVQKSGTLTMITVNSNNYYGGGMVAVGGPSDGSGNQEAPKLTRDTVKDFLNLEHVVASSPMMYANMMLRKGEMQADYFSMSALNLDVMKAFQLKVAQGALPEPGEELKLVVGPYMGQYFYNPRWTQRDYEIMYSDPEYRGPDVAFMEGEFWAIYDMDSYWNSQNDPTVPPPKKYKVKAAAVLEETMGMHDYQCYVDIDALEDIYRKVFKGRAWPGQPTDSNGKPIKGPTTYQTAYVIVDDMNNVMEVQEQLKAMGFEAWSDMQYIGDMMQQSQMIQTVLGGIGAVALLVAAIGITNTMMMSIYERTKEIGVIKVLGCSLGNIRSEFLTEAGIIGLLGGLFGIGLSYGLSFLLNTVLQDTSFLGFLGIGGYGGTVSMIPPWLGMLSVGFAILVGMISGFMPAIRAMRLSPLAAIRSE